MKITFSEREIKQLVDTICEMTENKYDNDFIITDSGKRLITRQIKKHANSELKYYILDPDTYMDKIIEWTNIKCEGLK